MVKNRFWDTNRKTPKVKICGVKTIDAAYNAYLLGADAVGFHLWSWDNKEQKMQTFSNISSFLPDDLSRFLLTDIKDPAELLYIVTRIQIDTLQLQGEISLDQMKKICNLLRERKSIYIVKTIPPTIEMIPFSIQELEKIVDGIVLDSGWYGGSGQTHNWSMSAEIARNFAKPVILAGGLRIENVKEAIKIIQPYGVDVETGVEDVLINDAGNKLKVKNFIKIINFIKRVKGDCNL